MGVGAPSGHGRHLAGGPVTLWHLAPECWGPDPRATHSFLVEEARPMLVSRPGHRYVPDVFLRLGPAFRPGCLPA